jgi:hypothetical protein
MSSSASLHYSQFGRSYFQRVYVAFAGNSDLCLSVLRHCADYGEKVFTWCFPSITSPTTSQVGFPHVTGLRERATGLRPEVTGVSAKRLKTLEGVGSVGSLLHGPGTPSTHHVSPQPTLQSFTVSRASYKDPPKPDIVITPFVYGPQGLHNAVGLGSGSCVSLPAAFQSSGRVYRTSGTIEEGQRSFGQDITLRRPRESFLHLTWLALRDKVLVSSMRSSTLFGSQT